MPRFDVNVPTIFGRGTVKEVGVEAKNLGITRALLVHGPVLPKEHIDKVRASLTEAGIVFVEYGGVEQDVPDYTVEAAVKLVEDFGGVDGVVGIGGGSTLDTAAVVNMMLRNTPPVSKYFICNGGLPENAGYPLIQIPTTSGTGAESTMAAVVYDTGIKIKRPLFNKNCLLASVAIIDPELCLTMPADLTAWTGFDAFSHAFESFTTNWSTMSPASDAMNKEAMRLIVEYLPLAVANPGSIEYREKMAYAATLAGIGTANGRAQKGHCFGHAIGSMTHAPHGVCITSCLALVAEHTAPWRYERCKFVAELFGINVYNGMPGEELGVALYNALRNFEKKIGVPSLKTFGATREKVMGAIELIVQDGLFRNNEAVMSVEKATDYLKRICDYYNLE